MGWQVVYYPRSRQNLPRIVKYIARDNQSAAARFGLALIDRAESLGSAPEIGVPNAGKTGHAFSSHRLLFDHLPP